jgi:hypothetical protein
MLRLRKLKQQAEADAEAKRLEGPPEANNFTLSRGKVDVNMDAYKASERIQEVLQDNDEDLINATNTISTKIVEDSFNTMRQNVSSDI